jgi:hypothetical protein
MLQQGLHLDGCLAALGKLGPVVCHRHLEVQQALIDKSSRQKANYALRAGKHGGARVCRPRKTSPSLALPNIYNRNAILKYG